MSVFFNYSNPSCIQGQSNCPFSIDPSIGSLKELLMYELKQISYYIVKLDELDIDTKEIRDEVIYYISFLGVNLDFKREEFNKLIQEIREHKKATENKYLEICTQKSLPAQPLKPSYDLTPGKPELIRAINEGERQALLKNTILSKTKKYLHESIMHLVQTCASYLLELDNYDIDDVEGKMAVIKLLNVTNFPSKTDERWIEKVTEFSKINFRIMQNLKDIMVETYGPLEEKLVDMSIRKGPAILVSGHFIKDLNALLEATKDEGINIYTHNGMIIAHSAAPTNKHPHLAGHYRRSNTDDNVDFETFPGPILMSKNSQTNRNLIRGRIFTMDQYPAFGLSKIGDHDFTELIKAAKESEGFEKEVELGKIKVGFNKEKVLNKLHEIFLKIKNGEIKHLYIIDMMNQYPYKNHYLEDFFRILPDDHFVISLSYPSNKPNIWHMDSYYGYSVIYLILSELQENFDMEKLDVTAILTQCNTQTIANILNLKNSGIRRLYLGNCCPLTINPTLVEGLNELYGVRYMTENPAKDFEDIFQKDNY